MYAVSYSKSCAIHAYSRNMKTLMVMPLAKAASSTVIKRRSSGMYKLVPSSAKDFL